MTSWLLALSTLDTELTSPRCVCSPGLLLQGTRKLISECKTEGLWVSSKTLVCTSWSCRHGSYSIRRYLGSAGEPALYCELCPLM